MVKWIRVYISVADSPWMLAKQRRDRKIPYAAADGYGTIKPHGSELSASHADDADEPSPLFLPTNDANFALPSVGDKLVKPRLHDTAACQTGCQTDLTTGWTTGCIVYTNIQPVVKPVVQPTVQLCSRLDNRLHHVNKHPTGYHHLNHSIILIHGDSVALLLQDHLTTLI